jgi:hypothetical protein
VSFTSFATNLLGYKVPPNVDNTAGLNLNASIHARPDSFRHSNMNVQSSPILVWRMKKYCRQQVLSYGMKCLTSLEAWSTRRLHTRLSRSGSAYRSMGQICRTEVREARGRHGRQKMHLDSLTWEHGFWYATTVDTPTRNPCSTIGHSKHRVYTVWSAKDVRSALRS